MNLFHSLLCLIHKFCCRYEGDMILTSTQPKNGIQKMINKKPQFLPKHTEENAHGSEVWKFFEACEPGGVTHCCLCLEPHNFPSTGTTSTLRWHLNAKHKIVPEFRAKAPKRALEANADAVDPPSTPPNQKQRIEGAKKSPDSTPNPSPYGPRSPQQQRIQGVMVKWLVNHCRPLHLAQDEGFKEFVAELNQRFEVWSCICNI